MYYLEASRANLSRLKETEEENNKQINHLSTIYYILFWIYVCIFNRLMDSTHVQFRDR